MRKQDATKVDVQLNALCYALGQAIDYIPVVYDAAEYDDEMRFKQVQQLAQLCWQRFSEVDDDARANCMMWNNIIIDVAKCKTLDEYKQLMYDLIN